MYTHETLIFNSDFGFKKLSLYVWSKSD